MEDTARQRPLGISILSVLFFIGGVLGGIVIVLGIFLVVFNTSVRSGLAQIGFTPFELLLGMAILFGLSLGSAIGMWKGKSWGWVLGSFYCMYGVINNLYAALITFPTQMRSMTPEEIEDMSRGPGFYYFKFSFRAFWYFLFYLYFFKGNVRVFFGLSEQSKWKPFLVELGICLVLFMLSAWGN